MPAMEGIRLAASDKTPGVVFDPVSGTWEISGCSIHENADRFFIPLIDQAEHYAKQPAKRTVIRIALSYFNSSTAKYLLDLLRALDEIHATGKGSVHLEWQFEEGDLDTMEAGEDYKGLLEMPVKLVER